MRFRRTVVENSFWPGGDPQQSGDSVFRRIFYQAPTVDLPSECPHHPYSLPSHSPSPLGSCSSHERHYIGECKEVDLRVSVVLVWAKGDDPFSFLLIVCQESINVTIVFGGGSYASLEDVVIVWERLNCPL